MRETCERGERQQRERQEIARRDTRIDSARNRDERDEIRGLGVDTREKEKGM